MLFWFCKKMVNTGRNKNWKNWAINGTAATAIAALGAFAWYIGPFESGTSNQVSEKQTPEFYKPEALKTDSASETKKDTHSQTSKDTKNKDFKAINDSLYYEWVGPDQEPLKGGNFDEPHTVLLKKKGDSLSVVSTFDGNIPESKIEEKVSERDSLYNNSNGMSAETSKSSKDTPAGNDSTAIKNNSKTLSEKARDSVYSGGKDTLYIDSGNNRENLDSVLRTEYGIINGENHSQELNNIESKVEGLGEEQEEMQDSLISKINSLYNAIQERSNVKDTLVLNNKNETKKVSDDSEPQLNGSNKDSISNEFGSYYNNGQQVTFYRGTKMGCSGNMYNNFIDTTYGNDWDTPKTIEMDQVYKVDIEDLPEKLPSNPEHVNPQVWGEKVNLKRNPYIIDSITNRKEALSTNHLFYHASPKPVEESKNHASKE